MMKLQGGAGLSLLKIFAILSLIGLVIFWFFTILAIPMSSEQPTVITGQCPLFLWIVFMSLFTGASAILSLTVIIRLAGRIDAQEALISQILLPPSEPEAE